MKNKIIISIIIIIAVCAVFTYTNITQTTPLSENGKINTEIDAYSDTDLKGKDIIDFKLTDLNDNSIPNQVVTITYQTNGQNKTVNATTDATGSCHFVCSDQIDSGHSYETIKYKGNDQYNPCETTILNLKLNTN